MIYHNKAESQAKIIKTDTFYQSWKEFKMNEPIETRQQILMLVKILLLGNLQNALGQ